MKAYDHTPGNSRDDNRARDWAGKGKKRQLRRLRRLGNKRRRLADKRDNQRRIAEV